MSELNTTLVQWPRVSPYRDTRGTTMPRKGETRLVHRYVDSKGVSRRRGVQTEDKDVLPTAVSTRGDRTKSDRDKEEAR